MKGSSRTILTLKEFLVRQDVLKVYKQLMKSVYKIEDATYRIDLLVWIRGDFNSNKHLKDEASIKIELIRAKNGLNELETSMNMAK